MIEFDRVSRRFGDVVAVDNLNFSIDSGEVVGLLGANGAGKTTTMRLLTGFYPPTYGEIRIKDQPFQQNPVGLKRHFGYLPESLPLYDEMEVDSYLGFVADLKGVDSSERTDRINHALTRLQLNEQANRLIGNLSRGYRQRVGLAQAIIHQPDILVLDEPTLGLDPKQVRRLRELIQELAEDSTLFISSHILHEVRQLCQRVIILQDGEIVAVNSPETLAEQIQQGEGWELETENQSDAWEQDIRKLDSVRELRAAGENSYRISFTGDDYEGRRQLFETCSDHQVPILQLNRTELDLEEIFLDLTRDEPEAPEPEGSNGSD